MLRVDGIEIQRVGEAINTENPPVVQLLALEDVAYDPSEDPETNIRTNRGGRIEFYADFGESTELLAVFGMQAPGASKVYELVLPDSGAQPALGTDGLPGARGGLFLLGRRVVYQRISDHEITTSFALRALQPRPGDDVLLRFAVHEGERAAPTEANARDRDVAVVYDKKLLWRANLYIAESGRDWNTVNPWDAPPDEAAAAAMAANGTLPSWWKDEFGYNSWNRRWDPSVSTAYTFNDLPDLPVGDGGQVIVQYPEWVRYTDGLSGNQQGVTAVPYTWLGADDPFDVIWKLRHSPAVGLQGGFHQAEAMWLRAEAAKPVGEQQAPSWEGLSGMPPEEVPAGATLPGGAQVGSNAWYRYVFATSETDAEGDYVYSNEPVKFTVAGVEYSTYPYVPGLTMYHHDRKQDNTYTGSQVMKSIGVDCSGFVQSSANYSDNPYTLPRFQDGAAGRVTWTRMGDAGQKEVPSKWSEAISAASGQIAVNSTEALLETGTRIVPGDILYKAGEHVAIVNTIYDRNGNGVIDRNEVSLIEAASGAPDAPNTQPERPIYNVMNIGHADNAAYNRYVYCRLSVR